MIYDKDNTNESNNNDNILNFVLKNGSFSVCK